MNFLKATNELSLAAPEIFQPLTRSWIVSSKFDGLWCSLTLLFAVMMVFSRLDDATHHQMCKKSSIRSELPQVKYWLPPPCWFFCCFCSLLQYWSLFPLINQVHSSKNKRYHLPCPTVPSPPSSHNNLNHNPENNTRRFRKTTQNLCNDHSWSTQKGGGRREQERKQRSQRIESWANKCSNSETKERKNKTQNHATDALARTAKRQQRRRQTSDAKGKRRDRS